MKYLSVFFLLFHLQAAAQVMDLDPIRRNYPLALSNASVCKSMIYSLENNQQQDLALGYLGAYQAIWANHAWNPIEKLNTFRKGKANIEKAIAQRPDEVELRFIRLSIQKNSPKILNYYSDIPSDKNFILKKFETIENRELRKLILDLWGNEQYQFLNQKSI